MIKMEGIVSLNDLSRQVVDCVFEVHTNTGPGLLESVYEECLAKEFDMQGIQYLRQHDIPVKYKNYYLDKSFRVDFLVENGIILELKAVDSILPLHTAQLLTYLKLSDYRLGLLINFNVPLIKNGIKRIANNL